MRKSIAILSLAAVAAFSSTVVYAVPVVSVGNHLLFPNTPGQTFAVMVSGGEHVSGLDLYLLMNNNMGGPIITQVDVIGPGTIFNPNNVGQYTLGPPYDTPGYEPSTITATSSFTPFVSASGVLAYVTVDTTGWIGGTFPLSLSNPDLGPTDFAVNPGFDAILVDGTVTITPEPGSVVLSVIAMVSLGIVAVRKLRAQRKA